MTDEPTKHLEHFHLFRAALWVFLFGPVLYATGLYDQVWVVLVLSLYANAASDFGAWQGGRAERRSLENP